MTAHEPWLALEGLRVIFDRNHDSPKHFWHSRHRTWNPMSDALNSGVVASRHDRRARFSQPQRTAGQADDLPEQMRVRRDKRERMLQRGIDPYPLNVARTHSIAEIVASFDAGAPSARTTAPVSQVAVTGRVIFLRNTGKLCFARLREGDGSEIQAMFSLADLGEESLADFKALVDIGDHLSVEGEVITSRRGELSIQAARWTIAAKTLRPLPNEHRPLSDEARVRLRYVDMIVRPEARDIVRAQGQCS